MGLILQKPIVAVDVSVENASSITIVISKSDLSAIYNIPDRSILIGEILKISPVGIYLSSRDHEIIGELSGKNIEFILLKPKTGTNDLLAISLKSWNLLRDYGILPGKFEIKVIINKVMYNENVLEIFPKRDVSI